MHADLGIMLNSDQYSDEMKQVVRNVMANLENDQKAIEQGLRIDELQLSFEVVETGVEKRKDSVEIQQKHIAETEEYLEEFDQGQQAANSRKSGFFRILFKWLNTPWGVSWKDVKDSLDE
jgi:hypothetical protein